MEAPGGDGRNVRRYARGEVPSCAANCVCNGALVYAHAGLLDGRAAATHWSAVERLRELGVEVDADARFVDEGEVVTSAGVSAGIDMALHLVERLHDREMAEKVRRYLQYEPASATA